MEKIIKRRHLKPIVQYILIVLTVLNALYCLGSENTIVVASTFAGTMIGLVVLNKYGGIQE